MSTWNSPYQSSDVVLGPSPEWRWLLLPAGYRPECRHPYLDRVYYGGWNWETGWDDSYSVCGLCGERIDDRYHRRLRPEWHPNWEKMGRRERRALRERLR